jgi:hypothetical protein
MNLRFVLVWSMLRGGLKTPEALDDANQWRAFSAWRMSESRDVRVEFEMSDRVIWAKPVRRKAGR